MKKIQIFLGLLRLQITESFTMHHSLDRIIIISTFIGGLLSFLFITTIVGESNILRMIISASIPTAAFLILILVKNIMIVIKRLKFQNWEFEKLTIAIPFKKFTEESDSYSLSAFQKFAELIVASRQNEIVLTHTKLTEIADATNFEDVWIHFPSKDDYLIYLLSR